LREDEIHAPAASFTVTVTLFCISELSAGSHAADGVQVWLPILVEYAYTFQVSVVVVNVVLSKVATS
jgi:hypothetical protein